MTGTPVAFATNNGDIAGGEVMLFAMAQAAREAGYQVTVVAPSRPGDVVGRARAEGFRTIEIKATEVRSYLSGLRRWDAAERTGLLWCNGLRPGLATAGHAHRVLHLHQPPRGRAQRAFFSAARAGTRAVVVPSESMRSALPGSQVLLNWCPPVPKTRRDRPQGGVPITLGYLGRHSSDKGLAVLGEALARAEAAQPGRFRLLLAGDGRFVPEPDQAAVRSALAPVERLIERPGWIARTDFFSAVDLAVFPSVWPEPFGLVAAEAMSAGVPFVISDAGALPEVAGPGHPWTVRAGDPGSLAAGLLSAADELDRWDRAPGRERWEREFSPTAGRTRLTRLLGDLGVHP